MSWYWPPSKPFPPALEKAIEYLIQADKQYIIAADTNAHSSWWGSPRTDNRGTQMEEVILTLHAHLMNRNCPITFQTTIGSSAIDITLVSGKLAELNPQWRCGRKPSYSDHKLIELDLQINTSVFWSKSSIITKCNWDLFGAVVEEQMDTRDDEYWTSGLLETAATNFAKAINVAADEATPSSFKPSHSKYSWWTDDLQLARTELKTLRHQARSSQQAAAQYKDKRTAYIKLIHDTKRKKWQDFTSESNSIALQAKLTKLLFKEPQPALGSLQDGGDRTTSTDASLKVLLDEHFPHNKPFHWASVSNVVRHCPKFSWITKELVSSAIRRCQKRKAPGPDAVRPEHLMHLPDVALKRLTTLFGASISLHYIPQCWAKAKVIFIPKAAKSDYSDPRSFRPITLSSYILKILERLVLWKIEADYLRIHPLSQHQCGFRKGHSTDLAITRVIQPLEMAKQSQSFVSSLFMDIKGAFDNVPYAQLRLELTNKQVDADIVAWYDSLLLTRHTTATNEKSGHTVTISHTRGVPQGGILSPLMWNLFFDPLLTTLKTAQSFMWISPPMQL